jgi:hypothetical protein
MRRICSELDDVREEAERLHREITGEARRLSEVALNAHARPHTAVDNA